MVLGLPKTAASDDDGPKGRLRRGAGGKPRRIPCLSTSYPSPLSPVWGADLAKAVPKMVIEIASEVQMAKAVAAVVAVVTVVEAAGVEALVVVILVVPSSPIRSSTCLFSSLLLPKSLSSTPY